MKITGKGHMQFDRKRHIARVRYSTGKQPDGSYGQISKTFYNVRTLAEAWAASDAYRAEVNGGMSLRGGSTTLAEYIPVWMAAKRLAHGTVRTYDSRSAHIIAHVGSTALEDVDIATAGHLAEAMEADGRSACTIGAVLSQLHAIVRSAVNDGLIARDRLHALKPPKPTTLRPRRALSPADAERFRRESMGHLSGANAAMVLGLSTGARIGEILALTWRDIDFAPNVAAMHGRLARISISKQCKDGKEPIKPKTDASMRSVWVDDATRRWLLGWQHFQQTLFSAYGATWTDEQRVCLGVRLAPMTYSMFYAAFTRWCREHGFDGLRFHELRHTMATLKLAAGIDIKTVQADGGWTTPATLMGIYAHAVEDNRIAAAEGYGQLLSAK